MDGWVMLHRKFIDWEWYDDINVKILFLHMLLKANHKDKKWRGFLIKRGELLTGRKLLSKETGLSEQQIRTAINKLKSTLEITTTATMQGTVISLVKYELYQTQVKKQPRKQPRKQPDSNQTATTNNNDNNIINKNKDFYLSEIENNNDKNCIKEYKLFHDILLGKNISGDELTELLQMPKQVSYDSFEKLLEKSKKSGKKFSNILPTMANDKKYYTKTSLSRTIHTWLNNGFK